MGGDAHPSQHCSIHQIFYCCYASRNTTISYLDQHFHFDNHHDSNSNLYFNGHTHTHCHSIYDIYSLSFSRDYSDEHFDDHRI